MVGNVSTQKKGVLTSNQSYLFEIVNKYFSCKSKGQEPEPFQILLTGGPGTGKTFFIQQVTKLASFYDYEVTRMAPTGAAAANMIGGQTIHSIFGFSVNANKNIGGANSKDKLPNMNVEKKAAAQMIFSRKTISAVDEFFVMGSKYLSNTEQRFGEVGPDPNKLFGGVPIILLGDPFQMGPKGEKSLIQDVFNYITKGPKWFIIPDCPDIRGIEIFMKLRRVDFSEQVRCVDNAHFLRCEGLRANQNLDKSSVTQDFIQFLRTIKIKQSDFIQDPAWLVAPILVTNNLERDHINYIRLVAFASYYKRPIIRWKYKVSRSFSVHIEDEEIEAIYEENNSMWQYFTFGAPCMCIDNIAASKGFANGSIGWQHSLSFEKVFYLHIYIV